MCDKEKNEFGECNGCNNELNLCSLCVKHVKAGKIKAECIDAEKLCVKCLRAYKAFIHKLQSELIEVEQLNVLDQSVNDLCVSGKLSANHLSAQDFNANAICAQSANFKDLCVTNLRTAGLTPFFKHRATVNYKANTVYRLGTFLNFDNIVDDPNNNITLGPTTYTVPLSGYYMMTYKVNITKLKPDEDPILGVPIALPSVFVNGILVREQYSPFVTFVNEQKSILTTLITLQQGDKLTMKYDVLVGEGVPVAGTVDIIGAGIEDGNSLFKIVLLTQLMNTGGQPPPCEPCPLPEPPCKRVSIRCDKDC